MQTFIDIDRLLAAQPPRVGVLLGRIDVGKGSERLHEDQLPELLTSLAHETRVESIRASTAIEGYEVDQSRARALADRPGARIRNRNEQEFAGYRDAIDELMRAARPEQLSVPYILHLHRMLFSHSGGAGGRFKESDNEIAQYGPDGRREVVFQPPPAPQAAFLTTELVARYNAAVDAEAAHPLVLLGVLILDLLAIHPVADGNGRLARLVTTHELLRARYGIARYVSVEQRIYETKAGYYAALRSSQSRWHDSEHNVWPWIEYLCGVLAVAYDTFEARVSAATQEVGLSKQERVLRHVGHMQQGREFTLAELRRALPGISDQTIRLALADARSAGEVEVDGRGRGARWRRRLGHAERRR